ncbi:hypothetical protein LG3211_1853 [Lysobacter gummosus]|nr:hypothetical protein LG3211_1853 [Lysobacter gummosus]
MVIEGRRMRRTDSLAAACGWKEDRQCADRAQQAGATEVSEPV